MPKFRHKDICTQNIQFIMATMPDSDNKQHLMELTRFITSILLAMHNSSLSPRFAALTCARSILFRQRGVTAKTRRVLLAIAEAQRPEQVIKDLIVSINTIEADYARKISSGLFSAA